MRRARASPRSTGRLPPRCWRQRRRAATIRRGARFSGDRRVPLRVRFVGLPFDASTKSRSSSDSQSATLLARSSNSRAPRRSRDSAPCLSSGAALHSFVRSISRSSRRTSAAFVFQHVLKPRPLGDQRLVREFGAVSRRPRRAAHIRPRRASAAARRARRIEFVERGRAPGRAAGVAEPHEADEDRIRAAPDRPAVGVSRALSASLASAPLTRPTD